MLNDAGVMVAPGEEADALRRYIEQRKSQPDTGDVAALREALTTWAGDLNGRFVSEPYSLISDGDIEALSNRLAALSKPNAQGAEECGGCGQADPLSRCVGCLHDFTGNGAPK